MEAELKRPIFNRQIYNEKDLLKKTISISFISIVYETLETFWWLKKGED
jgi:hypothetical protein